MSSPACTPGPRRPSRACSRCSITWRMPASGGTWRSKSLSLSLSLMFCLKLSEPDFETFSLPSLCSDAQRRAQFEDYCRLSESLPDLGDVMHLMHLAEYPLDFNENIKNLFKWAWNWLSLQVTHQESVCRFDDCSCCFRNFKRSNNTLPKLSYIPTCFYGKKAQTYWSTRLF